MTLDQAIKILGINRSREGYIEPMVRTLKLWEPMNSEDDNRRLAAGRYVLRNWAMYQAESRRQEDRPIAAE